MENFYFFLEFSSSSIGWFESKSKPNVSISCSKSRCWFKINTSNSRSPVCFLPFLLFVVTYRVSFRRRKKMRRCPAWVKTALAVTAVLVVVAVVVISTVFVNLTGKYFIFIYALISLETRSRVTTEVSGRWAFFSRFSFEMKDHIGKTRNSTPSSFY